MTKVLSLSSDKDCLNFAGIFMRPLLSREYEYSPMNVSFVKVILIRSFYPQLPTMLIRWLTNVNIIYLYFEILRRLEENLLEEWVVVGYKRTRVMA